MSDLLVRVFGWRALLLQGDPVVLERWKWLRRRFPPPNAPGAQRILDAGCGNGCFALWAAAMGNDVLGLSDAPEDLGKAQARAGALGISGARFDTFDLRNLVTAGETLGDFDGIFCLEVIEHVLDDAALLRNLSARLRVGGTLWVSSPTDDHKPLFREEAHLSPIEDGRHVRWGYSEAQLTAVLEAAGLEPVEFARFGGYLTQRACGALWRLSEINFAFAWMATFPLRAVTIFDARLTRMMRQPFMSVGVVARRKL